MRFQPIIGNLLAAASDKVVSIFDVETDRQIHTFQVFIFLIVSVDDYIQHEIMHSFV